MGTDPKINIIIEPKAFPQLGPGLLDALAAAIMFKPIRSRRPSNIQYSIYNFQLL